MKKVFALSLGVLLSQQAFADLYIYNGQHKGPIENVAKEFQALTGEKVVLRHGKSADLLAVLKVEGDKTPADILISESSAAFLDLGNKELLEKVDANTLKQVDVKNVIKAEKQDFLPIGIRSRVVAYNPTKVKPQDIPATLTDMVNDPKWKGRFGYHAGSSALVVQVSDHIKLHGVEATEKFLKALKDNASVAAKHMAGLKLVSDGELDLMIMNQYYLQRLINEKGAENVNAKIHYMNNGEADAALTYSTAGILKSSKNKELAQKFLAFISSKEGNELYTSHSFEWPTNKDAKVQVSYLPKLDTLVPPKVTPNTFADLDKAKELIKKVGLKNK